MKIQIDEINKIISLEEKVKLFDLIKILEVLLPKSSSLGYYKDYSLETNSVIYNWFNPYHITYPLISDGFIFTSTDTTSMNQEPLNHPSVMGIYNFEIN